MHPVFFSYEQLTTGHHWLKTTFTQNVVVNVHFIDLATDLEEFKQHVVEVGGDIGQRQTVVVCVG